jgi:hypothetical protein
VRVDLLNKFPELQDYFTFCSPGYCYGVQGSPNGQWIYLTNFWSLHIFNVNGERVGKYSFRDIYRHIADYCLGYIDGAHWSKDGRYLYVTINPCGNGGTESYFQYATAGVRVNLEDGDWSDVGCLGHSRFHQMMNI